MYPVIIRILAITLGVLLDLCLGDPHGFPHPVRAMGKLIGTAEGFIRNIFPHTEKGQLAGGCVLTVTVLSVTGLCAFGLLGLARRISMPAAFVLESVMCYQMLAARSLKEESMKVYRALQEGDTEKARAAVSMIVGRDTDRLSREGIIKAAVETVAENTSDGVIAPLFYMALGGGGLAFLYKAVNTMDSMVGYRNEKYLYFGRCAARLDDLVNWIPARLSAVLMVGAAFLLRLDGKNGWRIFRRDRLNHKSPNSAQTESVCAGALNVQLAGNAYYFGKLYEKPTIGDDVRPVELEDIRRANRLMMTAAAEAFLLLTAGLWFCFLFAGIRG